MQDLQDSDDTKAPDEPHVVLPVLDLRLGWCCCIVTFIGRNAVMHYP